MNMTKEIPNELNSADIKTLALDISEKCQWDGKKILEIAHIALEDANFHSEALIINDLIRNLEY